MCTALAPSRRDRFVVVAASGLPRESADEAVKPVAVFGEMVLVPDATGEFTAGDLVGLPEAARGLRTRLEGET
ncbi:hypothetical protein [Streptomyces vinaceus]|uniref:hypothetical protein n=1 Tax=Streptomyces vinaceus TaxID=1960 RepID=UPI0036BE15DA